MKIKDSKFTDFLYNFSIFSFSPFENYVKRIRARDRFSSKEHKKIMKFFEWMRTPEGEKALKSGNSSGTVIDMTKIK